MNDMNEITDELLARYMEHAGDLSSAERKKAEQWILEHNDEYRMMLESMHAQDEFERGEWNPFFEMNPEVDKPEKRPSKFVFPGIFSGNLQNRKRLIAASIAAIMVVGAIISFLVLPSNNKNGITQAGMNGKDFTPWHTTEHFPEEWDLDNGDLVLTWESNAMHNSLEISTDGNSWSVIAKDTSKCSIQSSTLINVDTLYWYLKFFYENQKERIATGEILIKKT